MILIHLFKSSLFSLSPITLILDSVPDFLTNILPLPFIIFSAIFIDFITFEFLINSLFFTSIFFKIWGVFLNLLKKCINIVKRSIK